MRTTIEMAREAGLRDCTCDGTKGCLERFASLVRADERVRMATDKSKEAMKLALSALLSTYPPSEDQYVRERAAITALREALAEQPAQQEPLGFMNAGNILEMQQKSLPYAYVYPVKSTGVSVAVYTSPPAQRKPLTYEEITAISKQVAEGGPNDSIDRFVRAIEAAHGIKENT